MRSRTTVGMKGDTHPLIIGTSVPRYSITPSSEERENEVGICSLNAASKAGEEAESADINMSADMINTFGRHPRNCSHQP